MEQHSSKQELAEQLTGWWQTQTGFKTKRALAEVLKVHPDTLGDYFSGRKFPRPDIAERLCELTRIACLQAAAGAASSSGTVPKKASPAPPPPQPAAAASIDKTEGPGLRETPEAAKESPGDRRRKERAVLISLERTSCPFCGHDVARFCSCVSCGQQLVWASLPLEPHKD